MVSSEYPGKKPAKTAKTNNSRLDSCFHFIILRLASYSEGTKFTELSDQITSFALCLCHSVSLCLLVN